MRLQILGRNDHVSTGGKRRIATGLHIAASDPNVAPGLHAQVTTSMEPRWPTVSLGTYNLLVVGYAGEWWMEMRVVGVGG